MSSSPGNLFLKRDGLPGEGHIVSKCSEGMRLCRMRLAASGSVRREQFITASSSRRRFLTSPLAPYLLHQVAQVALGVRIGNRRMHIIFAASWLTVPKSPGKRAVQRKPATRRARARYKFAAGSHPA